MKKSSSFGNKFESLHSRLKPVHWVVAIAIVAVIVYLSTNGSSAATDQGPLTKIYVATAGNDRNPGTPAQPVRSVKQAVALGADIAVLMGKTYTLPMGPEHLQGGGITLYKSLLVITNQTPWEQSPSSSKGGYTEVLPAVGNGGKNIDYRFLKFKGGAGFGGNSAVDVTARFLKFQNTEFWGNQLVNVRYQGD